MHDRRSGGRAFALLLLLCGIALGPAPARADRASQAESLYRRALACDARNTLESRRQARECLEEATRLVPDRLPYELTLARLYYRMGFLKLARQRFGRIEALHPDSPEARKWLGLVWRRDYLKYLDLGSLARSIEELNQAVQLEPGDCDAWLNLVPLLVEKQSFRAALAAAEHAREADPSRLEGLLALGHAAFRLGDVSRADQAFRAALPLLPKLVRERYDDIAPVSSERDTATLRRLPPAEKDEFVRRFWKEHDPDLATLENEAQLEYWSRVTQAYFLFFDPRRRVWDERGEVYVRYGPPQEAVYNPVGGPNRIRLGSFAVHGSYPMNLLVWSYPSLGMIVPMEDRLLSEYYLRPISIWRDTDPAPDPDSLARRLDAIATRGGRGVFPMLPPGTKPLPVSGVLARFETQTGPRLLALLESPGGPADSLWAEWVVLDSTRNEAARGARTLSPSGCEPARLRVAEFAAELPPGDYFAGISVRSRDGGRGIFRAPVRLGPASARIELSDVVVSCGPPQVDPEVGGKPPAVRLAANPAGRVAGDGPLTVYFEMYNLTPDELGRARVEFEYTVRSAERDPRFWIQRLLAPRRPLPDLSASRQEEQTGSLRRQFVTVPIRALPAGRYRLEVRVRDLNAGTEAIRSAEFVKQGPGGPVG